MQHENSIDKDVATKNPYSPKLTVENICKHCEVGSDCRQPCEAWYDCFAGKDVAPERILKGGEID